MEAQKKHAEMFGAEVELGLRNPPNCLGIDASRSQRIAAGLPLEGKWQPGQPGTDTRLEDPTELEEDVIRKPQRLPWKHRPQHFGQRRDLQMPEPYLPQEGKEGAMDEVAEGEEEVMQQQIVTKDVAMSMPLKATGKYGGDLSNKVVSFSDGPDEVRPIPPRKPRNKTYRRTDTPRPTMRMRPSIHLTTATMGVQPAKNRN